MSDAAARSLRICVIGDSIAAGTGDEQGLGWHGRLGRAVRATGGDLTVYNLGIRGDTSPDIERRWQREAMARLPTIFPSAIVFQFGLNDCATRTTHGGERRRRVEMRDSLRLLKGVLEAASTMTRVLMIGPAPVDEDQLGPQLLAGITLRVLNRDIAEIEAAFAPLAASLDVPYLSVFAHLTENEAWQRALRAGDGIHPTGEGYAALASVVGTWSAWKSLIAITEDRP